MGYTKEEELAVLKEDMEDDYRVWQQGEQEIKDAIEWRDKKALNYAESAVKYYNFLNQK